MPEFLNIIKVVIPLLTGIGAVVLYLFKKIESAKDIKLDNMQRDLDRLDDHQRKVENQVAVLGAKQVDTDTINKMLDQRLAPMQHQLQQILDILMKK